MDDLRLQMMAGDKKARDRTSDERRDHQPERRTGDTNLARIGNPVLFGECRRPGNASAMAAEQRNRPAEQADKGVQPQGCSHGYTCEILQEHVSNRQSDQNQEWNAACPECLDVRVQTDRGEEIEKQEVARGEVERNLEANKRIQQCSDDTDEQSAGDRLRDIEVSQNLDSAVEPVAQSKDKNCEIKRRKAFKLHGYSLMGSRGRAESLDLLSAKVGRSNLRAGTMMPGPLLSKCKLHNIEGGLLSRD